MKQSVEQQQPETWGDLADDYEEMFVKSRIVPPVSKVSAFTPCKLIVASQ